MVTDEQLGLRPVLRTGELLEVVPGLIVTQHSGDGKANQDNYIRGLVAASPQVGEGTLLAAVDYANIDGPWVLEEDFRKLNVLTRYTLADEKQRFGVTAQAYDGEWRSTDQIPQRAVDAGLIDRFGYVDPTVGGKSHRYSLSADWSRAMGRGVMSAQAYAVDYELDLISNFTYALDREHGDQFEQYDERRIYVVSRSPRSGIRCNG